jgi:hypothetical protein
VVVKISKADVVVVVAITGNFRSGDVLQGLDVGEVDLIIIITVAPIAVVEAGDIMAMLALALHNRFPADTSICKPSSNVSVHS